MIYCFDVDGTICENSLTGDYSQSKPYMDRIYKINQLFDNGHKIIVYTARGMKRFNGNQVLCNKTFYQMTYDQLKSWGLKFDNLYLGKPNYDIWIDDKALDANTFFKS